IFPATITIIKQATPETSTSFGFTASPSPLANFSLVDDGTATNTMKFSNITNFQTYTVAENAPPFGWIFDSITSPCTTTYGSSITISNSTRSVSIGIKEGDDVVCTFNNHRLPATLVVIKHVINDNGGTNVAGDFKMNVTGGNPSITSASGSEAGTSITLDPGASYSVSESGPTGYAATYSDGCSGSIAAGATATCIVTNNDIQPKLI